MSWVDAPIGGNVRFSLKIQVSYKEINFFLSGRGAENPLSFFTWVRAANCELGRINPRQVKHKENKATRRHKTGDGLGRPSWQSSL
jgi:hypothetical protein